ncbi:MAG: hypothetical protein WC414_02735 [Patescibacteria group bacterium]
MSDFDRLLKLAQKTNGKIFIYDKCGGRHMLLLDWKEYEEIVEFQEEIDEQLKDYGGVSDLIKKNNLSEKQLIEKINKDIAIWKAKQDELKQKEEAVDIENEFLKKEWHSISEILNEKKQNNIKKDGSEIKLDELLEIKQNKNEFEIDKMIDETDYSEKRNIPFVEREDEKDTIGSFEDKKEDENDDEEPIFFEEPI